MVCARAVVDYGRVAAGPPRRRPRAGHRRRLRGRRIATTYPYLLAKYLADRGIDAEIVTLSGAVEIAPRLGRADAICDLVSTGSTLIANRLHEVETVLESTTQFIANVDVWEDPEKRRAIDTSFCCGVMCSSSSSTMW